MDGPVDAPSPELDDQPACGGFLEATPQALDELEAAFGKLLVVESVERAAQDEGQGRRATTRRFWVWQGIG